ncbi:hypothetical protein FXF51_06960 [Nonomuraea sp. PA05]|uniref:hypothetical protein n=1 Tax=Nonomuraea sp. PA05 TaxID=2604466 RepID=UPI0011DAE098|nr:hypothetical protein [Nonomuraea sp. PA05]TYB69887.1 hypothetical protein FXF51_06960 [Nonomuraea sp. PA05]
MTETAIHGLSVADLDDLIARARQAAQDDASALERAKSALSGSEPTTQEGGLDTEGWKRRVLILALRMSGSALAGILQSLVPQAADFVRDHAGQLAAAIDAGVIKVKSELVTWLVRMGADLQLANMIADVLDWYL